MEGEGEGVNDKGIIFKQILKNRVTVLMVDDIHIL